MIRRSLSFLVNQQLAGAYSRWMVAAESLGHSRAAMNKGLTRILNRELTRTFESWVDAATVQAERFRLMRKAALFMSDGKLARGLSTWQEVIERGVLRVSPVGRAVAYFMHRHLKAAWQSWMSEHAEGVLERLKGRKALGRMINQKLSRCWESWLAMLERVLPLRRALHHFLYRSQSLAWSTWSSYAARDVHMETTMREALIRLCSRELVRGWDEWAALALYERVMTTARATIRRSLTLVGFHGWRKGLRAPIKPDCEPRRPAPKAFDPVMLPFSLLVPPLSRSPAKAREPELLPRRPGQSPFKSYKQGKTPEGKPLTPTRGSSPRPQARPLGSANSALASFTPRSPDKMDYYTSIPSPSMAASPVNRSLFSKGR